MTKQIIIIFSIFCLALCPLLPAQAEEGETIKEKFEEAAEDIKEAVGEAQVDVLQAMGEKMIDNRLNALAYAQNLLASARLVASDVKTEVGSMLSENSSGLEALKQQISEDQNVDSLKDKVKSIVEDFRIYIVALPKAHGVAVVSHYRTVESKLGDLAGKIEVKGEELDVNGDVSTLIAEAKSELANSRDFLDAAELKLGEMSVKWPSRATGLNLEARAQIIEAKTSLHSAFGKLKQAIVKIRNEAGGEQEDEE